MYFIQFQSSSPQNDKAGIRKLLALLAIILESKRMRGKDSKDANRSNTRSVFKKIKGKTKVVEIYR